MMDLSHPATPPSRDTTGRLMEEAEDEGLGYHANNLLKTYKSEEFLSSPNPSYASLKKLNSPLFVRSTESVSSGYGSDILQSSFDLHRDETVPSPDLEQENMRWGHHWREVRESKQKLHEQ